MVHMHLLPGSQTPRDFSSLFPFSKGIWSYLPGSWSFEARWFCQDTIWLVRRGFGGKKKKTGEIGRK